MGKVVVNEQDCKGCGQCEEVCRFGALKMDGSTVSHDSEKCRNCKECIHDLDCPGDCFVWLV